MTSLRLSLTFFVLLGFLSVCGSNPITSLFGKSDDKAEADDKSVGAAPVAKPGGEVTTTTTTTTPEPSSSCGGLKGFLHICDKNEPTEPPKNIKTRSVDEPDDSDSDSDSDSSEESEEKTSVSEPTEKTISKRQADYPELPTEEQQTPEETEDAPQNPEDGTTKKRQVDNDSGEEDENTRRRRDCRDREGDYKDCRKKREYIPAGAVLEPKRDRTTAEKE